MDTQQPPMQANQTSPASNGANTTTGSNIPPSQASEINKPKSKFKLPSRNWLIFLSTTTVLTGLALYDKYLTKQERERLQSQVSFIAAQPLSPNEMPRKIKVYIMPGLENTLSTAKYQFKEYVKPILDAAAFDYDLIEGKSRGDITKAVQDHIWKGKRQYHQALIAKNYIEKAEAASRSTPWYKKLIGIDYGASVPVPDEIRNMDPMAQMLDDLQNGKFSEDIGMIAVGRAAYREMLQGMRIGCLAKEPEKVEETKPIDTATVPVEAIKEEVKEEGQDAPPPAEAQPATPEVTDQETIVPISPPTPELSIANMPEFNLPPIGYVSMFNKPGFKNFPLRVYNWFQDHKATQKFGEETVKVVLGETREMRVEDAALGREEEDGLNGGKNEEGEVIQIEKDVQLEKEFIDKLKFYC